MAGTPKATRKEMKKGATQLRAAANSDAGLPKTSAQKNTLKKSSKATLARVKSGNIGAGRAPKQVAADSARVKGAIKESNNPSMKLKAAQAKKRKAVMAKKSGGRGNPNLSGPQR